MPSGRLGLPSVRLRPVVNWCSHLFISTGTCVYADVKQSLLELHKRRHTITEPECRYFVRQVVLACAYLHRAQVIHRDLKLGNLFLNDAMEIKVGDFGLATRLDYDGERKL